MFASVSSLCRSLPIFGKVKLISMHAIVDKDVICSWKMHPWLSEQLYAKTWESYATFTRVRSLNTPCKMLQDAVKEIPLQEVMASILKGKWDHERTKFSLPPLMNLVSILSYTIDDYLYLYEL
jgi:hypothetical protein